MGRESKRYISIEFILSNKILMQIKDAYILYIVMTNHKLTEFVNLPKKDWKLILPKISLGLI